MRKLWENSEGGFFFLWLWVYLLAQSGGGLLSAVPGVEGSGTALLNGVLAGGLLLWLRRAGLWPCYRLAPPTGPVPLLPLVLLSTCNLWGGAAMARPPAETICAVLTVAGAALLEELLMRGLLFRWVRRRKGLRAAVAVSTLVFGGAHLLNLGELGLWGTLMQTAGALAFGLLSAVLLLRSGSLWPGILAHCTINALSVFAAPAGEGRTLLLSGVQLALMVSYTVFLVRTAPEHT